MQLIRFDLQNLIINIAIIRFFTANQTCDTTVTMVTVFATREYGMTQ